MADKQKHRQRKTLKALVKYSMLYWVIREMGERKSGSLSSYYVLIAVIKYPDKCNLRIYLGLQFKEDPAHHGKEDMAACREGIVAGTVGSLVELHTHSGVSD